MLRDAERVLREREKAAVQMRSVGLHTGQT